MHTSDESRDVHPSAYNARVDQPSKKTVPLLVVTPVISALDAKPTTNEDAMKCERCGADMYRMHAVWRCPSCRFKTDCCGW
jgi:rubrerythrin